MDKERLRTSASSPGFAAKLAERFGARDDAAWSEVARNLIDLHNSGDIDLWGIVESGQFAQLEGTQFFIATYHLCELIPDLSATGERLASVVTRLVDLGGDDLAANEPNSAFRKWCARNPNQLDALISTAEGGHPSSQAVLTFALEVLADRTRARRIAARHEGPMRLGALTALSRLPYKTNQEWHAELELVLSLVADSNDLLRAHLIASIEPITGSDLDSIFPEYITALKMLVADSGPIVLGQIARMLIKRAGAMASEELAVLVSEVIAALARQPEPTHQVDESLAALVSSASYKEVVDGVVAIAEQRDSLTLRQLPRFSRAILGASGLARSYALVQWLMSGERGLCEPLVELMTDAQLAGDPVALDAADVAGLTERQRAFLCRKAVAWFFVKPVTAASILISSLKGSGKELQDEIGELMVTVLLRNYGGDLVDYLKGVREYEQLIAQWLSDAGTYLDRLNGVPTITELRTSERRRHVQKMLDREQAAEIFKGARDRSVLLKLIKHSTLLYGRGAASFIGPPDQQQLMTTEMNSFGVSIELPRMEIADPLGLQAQLLRFRIERLRA